MNKLGTQAKSQFGYMKAHKGKMIGTGLGITTGIVYGMSGKQSNLIVAGLAVVGAAAGAILGGMFDKPNAVIVGTDENGDAKAVTVNTGDDQAMSNAIGSFNTLQSFNQIGRSRRKLYNCRHADGTYQNQTEPCGGTNIR